MSAGTCRYCMKKREVFRITRRGGGNWRRGGRQYWSSICGECATYLHDGGWDARFDKRRLERIAEEVAGYTASHGDQG